jgi:hypothetical protein
VTSIGAETTPYAGAGATPYADAGAAPRVNAETAPDSTAQKGGERSWRRVVMHQRILLLVVVAVVIAISVIYFINNGSSNDNSNNNSGSGADILTRLGAVMILPEGETPSISTVTDAEGLKNGATFYRDAENGDKILVYAQSGKIIIYREADNLIVNVGPIIDD